MTLYSMRLFWITCFAVVSYALPTTHDENAALYLRNIIQLGESTGQNTLDVKEVLKKMKAGIRVPGEGHRNPLWRDLSDESNPSVFDSQLYDDEDIENILLPFVNEKVEDFLPTYDNVSDKDTTSASNDEDVKNTPFSENKDVESTSPSDNEDVEGPTSASNEEDVKNTPPSANEDVEGTHYSSNEDIEDTGLPSYTNMCANATIDTITRIKSGSTYIFKGDFYWKILSNGGVPENYPRKISDDWDGLEGNLDASVTWSNGKTFFFKGNRYWRFTNKNMDDFYPKLISVGFEDIPDDLDAALVWGANGKTYFFKDDKYWRYEVYSDPPVSSGYPAPISAWSNEIADGIDAAFQWQNGRTYFFKGDKYYRYNDRTSQVDDGYPLSTAEKWFSCLDDETERGAFHRFSNPK